MAVVGHQATSISVVSRPMDYALPAIASQELFDTAPEQREQQARRLTDNEMLEALRSSGNATQSRAKFVAAERSTKPQRNHPIERILRIHPVVP